jgi:ABC-2 type transport system permease protein
MTVTDRLTPAATRGAALGRVWTIYRWEVEKLTAQWRVRIAVITCVVGPVAATLILTSQQQTPSDTLFGRWVHVSGSAVPLLMLSFVAQYAVPLLTCLVAGDIFAAEDHAGTWKMILTRSPGRTAVFSGKILAAGTYTIVVMLLLALTSTAIGLLVVGHAPLISLSGTAIPAGRATALVLVAWASALPPALGFTALGILFSITTRSGTAGIIGPVVIGGLMEVYAVVGSLPAIRMLLLSTAFDSWHGLFTNHPDRAPLVHGLITSTVYAAVCIAAGWLTLRRRDFTQG